MQSNPDLLQGELLVKEGRPHIPIPDGYAAVLSSPYGIEGVFIREDAIQVRVRQLRELAAYKDEDLAVGVHKLDAVA